MNPKMGDLRGEVEQSYVNKVKGISHLINL